VACQRAACGDRYLNTAAGEECESDGDCTDPTKTNCDTTSCTCK
jgi:hypothetical protein